MSQKGENKGELPRGPQGGQVDIEAIMRTLTETLRNELIPINERLARVERRTGSESSVRDVRDRGPQVPPRHDPRDDLSSHGGDFDPEFEEEDDRQRQGGRGGQNNLRNLKLNVPSFQGKSDLEEFLDWVRKMELLFSCHDYSEEDKVRIAVVEFTDYALTWWDQLCTKAMRRGERQVRTWVELKRVMRRRFVPEYYHRDLYQRLQGLRQGNQSVEDYYKELEMLLTRVDVDEDREATLARLMGGLNREIADVVDLHYYRDMEEAMQRAVKVEKQLKRRGRMQYPGNASSKPFPRRDEGKKPFMEYKKPRASTFEKGKGVDRADPPRPRANEPRTPNVTRTRDVICYKCQGRGHFVNQCPNKRTMIIDDAG